MKKHLTKSLFFIKYLEFFLKFSYPLLFSLNQTTVKTPHMKAFVIRPYKAECFLCRVRRGTYVYEQTEDLNTSPFTRMQRIGSFALYNVTTGQADISAFMTEQEIKYLSLCGTATITPTLYGRPEEKLTIQTHPT
jgi:hypothetical protein